MSNPYLPNSPSSSTFNHYNTSYWPQSPGKPNVQPITRSRTLFYLSIRDSSITPRRGPKRSTGSYGNTIDLGEEEEEGLLLGGRAGDHVVGMKGLPPRWVDISDEVEEILIRVNGKISGLEKLHAKHVLPGFTDRTAEEKEIERQTTDITRDFRKCSTLISSIQPSSNAPRVEITTAKNVQRGLAKKVQDASGVFRKKQRVYMQKLQGHAIKNKDLLAASGAISLKGPESYDELEDDEEASQNQLQSQSQSQITSNININQRTTEITQIASSITELADLFRDLSNLVVEQGTILDSVEYNVQTTVRELDAGVKELKVAQRYQANTGRRKCMLLLVLLILGMILVLIYKPRSSSTSPATPIVTSAPHTVILDTTPTIGGGGDEDITTPTSTIHTRTRTRIRTKTRTRTDASTSTRAHKPLPKPPPIPTGEYGLD